jgi:hypothetical protein
MFILGHIGISIGIIYLLAYYIHSRKIKGNPSASLAENIDFRIVIIAAMLPDIVDKIVGMIIFKDEISNGRLFTHSLLIVGTISIWLFFMAKLKYGHRFKMLFYISPIWIHLLLDRMWEEPHTLFWPIFGTSFPKLDIEFTDYFTILISSPYTFVGEILGIVIIITLLIQHRLFIKTHLFNFLKDGKLKIQAT